MTDEIEEVALTAQLVCMANPLAHVCARQHEAGHSLTVGDRRHRPRDVDGASRGVSKAMLMLSGGSSEHTAANGVCILRVPERIPEGAASRRVIVHEAGSLRERVVEADDPAVEVENAKERRCCVHDFAHEVALALQLVEPRS